MAHPRQLIRDRLVALLNTEISPDVYPTNAGANVFKSRVRAIFPDEMPCICVYANTDDPSVYTQAPLEYKRELELSIEIIARADDDLDDALDDIAQQVERILILNETLKPTGWAFDEWPEVRLGGTSITLKGNEGDTLHGSCVISAVATYYQMAPEDISDSADGLAADIQDFDTASVEWSIDGEQQGYDMASDILSLYGVFSTAFDETFG